MAAVVPTRSCPLTWCKVVCWKPCNSLCLGYDRALLFAHASGRPMRLLASPSEQTTLLIGGRRVVVFHHLTGMQMVYFGSDNLVRVLVHVQVLIHFDWQRELHKVGVQLCSSLGRRLFWDLRSSHGSNADLAVQSQVQQQWVD